jgi:hypothetical protein
LTGSAGRPLLPLREWPAPGQLSEE